MLRLSFFMHLEFPLIPCYAEKWLMNIWNINQCFHGIIKWSKK